MKISLEFVLILMFYSIFVQSQIVLQQILTETTSATYNEFGSATAISSSGNIIVISASGATINGNSDQGTAYVFTQNGTGYWNLQQQLVASDGTSGDYFGNSISISGNTIVIGASFKSSSQGAAYVFTQNGTGYWNQQQKLVASDGVSGDYFGGSVCILGNTIVVTAYFATINGNSKQGAAYVFTQNGSTWIQQQKLTASDGIANAVFGNSVSISGNTMIIGAPFTTVNGVSDAGEAYIFVQNGTGYWNQQQNLISSNGGQFGYSVSISGNIMVIGANYVNFNGNSQQGAAYVFTQNGTGYWNLQQELISIDGASFDQFGWPVSISGNTIGVAASSHAVNGNIGAGAVYIFTPNGTGYWGQQQLVASDGPSVRAFFGSSVSVLTETSQILYVIGASGANSYEGKTYLFTAQQQTTQQQVTTQQQTTQQQTTEQETTQQQTTQHNSPAPSEGMILLSSFHLLVMNVLLSSFM